MKEDSGGNLHEKYFDEVSKVKYRLKHEEMKINELYHLYRDNQLSFDTEYQRTEVWPLRKNRLLIDSILRKYDIATIFLRVVIERRNLIRYECIDGQQCLKCIFRFIDNEFDIIPNGHTDLEHKHFYDQLPIKIKSEIESFGINSVHVWDADDDRVTDIFMRLQEGVSLNHAERLNAIRSKMRKAAIEISNHEFFLNIPKLKNIRFAHRFYAAQMLTLTSDPNSSVADFNRLKGAYEMYKNAFPSQFQRKTDRSLTLLKVILDTKLNAIRSKSDLPILYLISSKLLSTYSISGFEDKIGFFILNFINRVEQIEEFNKASKDPYIRYKYFKKYQYLHIQEKYEIMASELLKTIPDMKPLDHQRLFNDTERLAIYLRANGKCEKCEKPTSLADGHADHRVRHTDGGLTTIENGRWLCIPDHNKIHGKKLLTKS